jgi:hypothetical protein
LHAGVAVIPVLVDGATMPSLDALPASLRAFARCQALESRRRGGRPTPRT